MRLNMKFAVALVIAALAGSPARATIIVGSGGEEFNAFEPLPPVSMTGGATAFTVVFSGDVISSLDLSATQDNPGLNPFAYVNSQLNNGGTTSVTATLDINGNTVVTFIGSNPISADASFDFGNNLPHVGLASSGSTSTPLEIISQAWSNGSSTFTLPSVSVSVLVGTIVTDPFAVVFAEVTSSGNTVGEWFELPYTGTDPRLVLTNYTGSSETLSNVGFILSPTMIPLDQLNFNDYPPPGTPGSPFTPLPSLDGVTLSAGNGTGGAGGSITTQSVPEPSSIIALATGLLVVAGYFGRRRIATGLGRAATVA